MKISLFNEFGALNSPPVFSAFEIAAKKLGHNIVYHDLMSDVFVIWSVVWRGRMAQNKLIWDYAVKNKIPVIVLEVGCLHRGQSWKMGINGLNFLLDHITDRRDKFNIDLKPWNKTGSNILICGQRTDSMLWSHGKLIEWLTMTVNQVRLYTDRNIIFRPHPRQPFLDNCKDLKIEIQAPTKHPNSYDDFDFNVDDAWVVINSSSNPGVQSLINGCPCITDKSSLAYELSTSIENVEKPRYDDREIWLNKICNTEWLLPEIESGEPVELLLDKVMSTYYHSKI